MGRHLKNKPLVEALVELKWALESRAPNVQVDPVYPLFLGRFQERVRDRFPFAEPLPAAQIPDELTPYVVKYRFREARDGWPLVQAGPGVVTLNFTGGYRWDLFAGAARPFFAKTLDAYAYEGSSPRPRFVSALLRFINAIDFDARTEDVLSRLGAFHTGLRLPDKVTAAPQVSGPAASLQLSSTWRLERPAGVGSIAFSTGTREGRPALIWEIKVQSNDEQVPQESDALENWLAKAHEVVETLFFALIEGEMERAFDAGGSDDAP